jgi:hypothetical protein
MVSIIRQGPLHPTIKNQAAPPEQNFQFSDDMLDFEDFGRFVSIGGEGVEGEVSVIL